MLDKADKIKHLLTRNVEEVIDRAHLEKALTSGKKLRVKLGIDPTGDKIHIGRAVILWKLREFQDLGHKIILIIGDFTAQIGDPSDKLEKRPFLSPSQIKKNLKNYLPQVGKILDLKKTEICYNGEWLKKLNFQKIAELAESFTMQQMLKRRNFAERLEKGQDINLRETFYPLMQGYDSVAVKADVELGGTDQLFNLLAGRKIQEQYNMKPQDVLLTGMLTGLDGRKMSTSWGNVINIMDSAREQYGKIMSMHDNLIGEYLHLATDINEVEIKKIEQDILRNVMSPKHAKEQVAFGVVSRYYGEESALRAAEEFDKLFVKNDLSASKLPEISLPPNANLLSLLVHAGAAESNSAARRLIEQGAVRINDEVKSDPNEPLKIKSGSVLKVGKHKFFRIR